MNTNLSRKTRKMTWATMVFLGALLCALPSYVKGADVVKRTVDVGPYTNPQQTSGSSIIPKGTQKLEITVNNSVTGTLKGDFGTYDYFKPGTAILKVSGVDLNSLTSFKVGAEYAAPSDAYSVGRYGLLIIDGGGRSTSKPLTWDISGFDSKNAGFGALVQFGGGVINQDSTGESVDLTINGTNTFGSYTMFGGRATNQGGNATVTFNAGNKTLFNQNAEAIFGGGSYTGVGGNAYVKFMAGDVEFQNQNAFFGGYSLQGFNSAGKAYVDFYKDSYTQFRQRVVFGGIGYLNAGYSEVNFYGGKTVFTSDFDTESGYMGVYFSAMAYYEMGGCPDTFGYSSGTTVNFLCSETIFNTMTYFGGGYNLDRNGNGDKDRTWGGKVNVSFLAGEHIFQDTTFLLDADPDRRNGPLWFWEGGTFFGGPGSNVNVYFGGGTTSFIGSDMALRSMYDHDEVSYNKYVYTKALAYSNGYDIFNSTNYADEVQFGGGAFQIGDGIYLDNQYVAVTASNVNELNQRYPSSTNVLMECGRIYFDNVRATFGGRVGNYLRYDSYMAELNNNGTYAGLWAVEDPTAPGGWSGGITYDFFTDYYETNNPLNDYVRNPNLFNDSGVAAKVELTGGAELRVGVNALLIGLAKGTEFKGTGGTLFYDFKIATKDLGIKSGGATQLDVGTLYFDRVSLDGTVVDISLEQIQDLTKGTYKTDIALKGESSINVGGAIGEDNRFYTVEVVKTDRTTAAAVNTDVDVSINNEYSLLVTVKKQIGIYDDAVGNVRVNRRHLNDLIYNHSDEYWQTANAVKEILKKSKNAREEAANFDILGGALYANMAYAQLQRITMLNYLLADQLYAEDAGRFCYGNSCARGMCCDTGCGSSGCGYNCGGYGCGDPNCGGGGVGTGGQVIYDEFGNPYPVYNQIYNGYRAPRFTLWARAYGFTGDTSYHNGFSPYDSNSFGGIFGMQFRVCENGKFGIYYAYGQTEVSSDAPMGWQNIKSNDHTIGLYGKWVNPERCGYHFLTANYSFSSNDSTRVFNQDSCTYMGTYYADYDSNLASVFFEKGWDWCVGCHWTINPYMNVQWAHYSADGFRESGGFRDCPVDGVNLCVNDMSFDSLRTGLGSRFAWRAMFCNPCHDLRLTANIAWIHDWLDCDAAINSMVCSASMLPKWRMYGNDGGRDWLNFGLGINYTFRDRITLGANWDLFANQYTTVNGLMAGVSVAW